MKRPNRSICAALVVSFLLVSSRAAEAGREMVPWDSLPQIETFVFSGTDLGLISMDNRRFTFHTKTNTLQEISETEFQRRFPYTMPPRARKVVKETGVGSEVLLRTSQSLVFTTRNAYCSEGDHTTHWLSLEGKPLKDFVKPCHSISTVEQVGDQLWLGTRYDGVYGDGEAEGIIIQSKDGTRKIGQISTQDGLTGNLVRAIRINPLDSLVWVATNQGLNAVASDLKIVKSVYFYQDFDPVTGAPIYLASPTFRENPMIVELVRQLRLSDYKAFRDAWRTIPKQAADKMVFGMIDNAYSCENVLNGNEAFAPSETNVLAPFFIEASRSMDDPTRYLAFRALGSLNDPRAVARFVELRSNCPGCGAIDEEIVSKYLDKYAYFYLLPKKEPNELALELQEGLQSALQAISNKGQCPSRQQPMATVVQNALRLKKMADPFGMNKINEYFKASDGNDEDASFYEYIGQHLLYVNDIWPAMVEGLPKFHTTAIARGCSYFDMSWNFMPRRYDATAAKAILAGLDHLDSLRSQTQRSATDSEYWNRPIGICGGAFKSQIADSATKKVFMEKYFASLSESEKALVNMITAW